MKRASSTALREILTTRVPRCGRIGEPRLAELDEGFAHRLAAGAELAGDVLLGEHLARSNAHRDDGLAQDPGDLPRDRFGGLRQIEHKRRHI